MKVKEIIVVEGRDDTAKIKQAVDADTIETNGSAINKAILEQIRHAQEKRGVIIFTDPDYPGERIRSMIDRAVPGCKHAFLSRDMATATNSIGIEHAPVEAIRKALSAVYELIEPKASAVQKTDLIQHGLIGTPYAAQRRKRLGELLHIGHTNGKQLLRRLAMFDITKEQLTAAISKIKQEEHDDFR
ncbi:MAG TPA: ribonuclease M5 [Bacillota bacterium]|nr:ribonuclease M5 [Bacillota bacterium]